jgi:hypothetical protein
MSQRFRRTISLFDTSSGTKILDGSRTMVIHPVGVRPEAAFSRRPASIIRGSGVLFIDAERGGGGQIRDGAKPVLEQKPSAAASIAFAELVAARRRRRGNAIVTVR